MWALCIENFENFVWTEIGRDYNIQSAARGTIQKWSYKWKFCHLLLHIEQDTHDSSKNTTCFLIFVFQFTAPQLQFMLAELTNLFKKPTES